jgi:hypothetical protein
MYSWRYPAVFPDPHCKKVSSIFNNFIRGPAEELGVLKCLKIRLLLLQKWASKLFSEVRTSQIRKFLGSFRSRKSPYGRKTQIFMIYLIIANLRSPTTYCTTLSQNELKSHLFERFLCYIQI